jgi:hypothetical protein
VSKRINFFALACTNLELLLKLVTQEAASVIIESSSAFSVDSKLDQNGRRTATEDSETMIPKQDFNKQNRDLRIF